MWWGPHVCDVYIKSGKKTPAVVMRSSTYLRVNLKEDHNCKAGEEAVWGGGVRCTCRSIKRRKKSISYMYK